MDTTFSDLFVQVFEQNHLQKYLRDDVIDAFSRLMDIMIEKNRVMNVTALTMPDKIIPLHYADCALIADAFPEGASVIDVGCGGGFPTLPLAILRPDLRIVGVDSTAKKAQYVAETAQKLGLRHVETVASRAEDLARTSGMREGFDIAVSRAVARLNILSELCLPFVRVGGKFIAMKGAAGRQEWQEAQKGVQILGGGPAQVTNYTLYTTQESEQRVLISIPKQQPTPATYPRPFSKIKVKPL